MTLPEIIAPGILIIWTAWTLWAMYYLIRKPDEW